MVILYRTYYHIVELYCHCGPYIPLWTSHICTIMEITCCRDGHYLLTLPIDTVLSHSENRIPLAWEQDSSGLGMRFLWPGNEIPLAWE